MNEENKQWFSPLEKPSNGQLCRLKCVTLVDAHYISGKAPHWVQKQKDEANPAIISAWRPLDDSIYKKESA